MKPYPRLVRQASLEHGGVCVWLGRTWLHDSFELCIAIHMGGNHYQAATGFADDGQMVFEEVDPGVETPVLCKMREDVLAALLKAASEALPVDGGMQRHLNDAIEVRDRLLTLVEKGRE